jgi:hypothetical protein
VPEDEAQAYAPVFEKIGRSIKFKDVQ